MIRIAAGDLEGFVTAIFRAVGCDGAEAARIGRYLTAANLAGHDSHGVARVPRYVDWTREGKVHPGRQVTRVVDTPSMAVLDGGHGFGQTVGPQAVTLGIAKAKAHGLSAIALRNTGHLGRIGDFGEMAAAEGLVSIHFVNVVGSILVAPHGGVDRRLSTAPYCIGVPLPGRGPLLLDFATSLVAEGKVYVAAQGGKPIPDDALILPDGATTGDPAAFYGVEGPGGPPGPAAIRAFGEHKGSGLAFMCEILGGALTGAGATGPDKPFGNGMFSLYIDPAVIDPAGLFPAEAQSYIDYYTSSRPVDPTHPVLVPGDMEAMTRSARLADGVPLPPAIWQLLVDVAGRLGVNDVPRPA